MTFAELQELQQLEQDARRRADQAAGAIEQKRKDLEQEFGVRTPKDAKRLREQLEKDIAEAERAADTMTAALKKKYPQLGDAR